VGDTIITWLWGGFSIDNATLNHFFSPHYLLCFIIVDAAILHLAALHQYGSSIHWVAFAIFFSIFIFYAPNVLGHHDYIPTIPMSTPAHIVP